MDDLVLRDDLAVVMTRVRLSKKQKAFADALILGSSTSDAAKAAGYKGPPPPLEHPRIRAYLEARLGTPVAQKSDVQDIIAPSEVLELTARIARSEDESTRDRLTALKLLGMFHGLWTDKSSDGQGEPVTFNLQIGAPAAQVQAPAPALEVVADAD